ncbi:MAG: hypothetical protein HPY64_04970 [Anaerolineae bacterium]|nr:hypothetical protein [Anaerolineae bacterium]
MSMLDRLRESAAQDDEELFGAPVEEVALDEEEVEERRFLGMTALERMLLSILIFLATSVLGTLLLIALRRIDIGL